MKTTTFKRFGLWLLAIVLPLVATAAPAYVDLGLSSGTLWATYNIGASSPEGFGNYYAWGEVTPKSTYTWANYQYASGSQSTVQDIGGTIAGTAYDAATKAWGSNWVMPTIVQMTELLNQCKLSLATLNGVNGLRLTGPNGNSIFLPLPGYKYDSTFTGQGTKTYYWSCRKDYVTNVDYKAGCLLLERSTSSASAKTSQCQRRTGLPIRAVRATGASANDAEFDVDGIVAAPVATPADGSTYTLQGVKVEGLLRPGVYIRDGKKFVVK